MDQGHSIKTAAWFKRLSTKTVEAKGTTLIEYAMLAAILSVAGIASVQSMAESVYDRPLWKATIAMSPGLDLAMLEGGGTTSNNPAR